MRTLIVLLAALLGAVTLVTAQSGGDAAPQSYGSYLSSTAQENIMLEDGLDADEIIGSEVVGSNGSRLGAVTDLLVGLDGSIAHAAVDVGQGLGVGSRHVAVPIGQLRPTEEGPRTVMLDVDKGTLAGLAAYRQSGDRWDSIVR
jgi:hypothetical protein